MHSYANIKSCVASFYHYDPWCVWAMLVLAQLFVDEIEEIVEAFSHKTTAQLVAQL